jgi:multimeric flavodoxin WrbA
MKTIIISSSPNKVGLTNDCVETCVKSLEEQNQEVETICLNHYNIKKCEACGPRGWGTCLEEHICRMKDDDFKMLHEKINSFDAVVIVSPVYFHEMSESAKTFFDRLRRCEAFNESSPLKGKQMLCIAAAGGSGIGTENCLNSMGLLVKFLNMTAVDYIGVSKANFEEKKPIITEAAMKMAKEEYR